MARQAPPDDARPKKVSSDRPFPVSRIRPPAQSYDLRSLSYTAYGVITADTVRHVFNNHGTPFRPQKTALPF